LRARWSEQREQAAAGPSVVLARAEASSRSGPQLGQGGTQQSHSNPHPTFSPTLLPEYLRTQLKSRGTQQLLNSYVTQPARKLLFPYPSPFVVEPDEAVGSLDRSNNFFP